MISKVSFNLDYSLTPQFHINKYFDIMKHNLKKNTWQKSLLYCISTVLGNLHLATSKSLSQKCKL